ncbi:MAG TPA: hypothetical protein VHF69_10780, partial [Candidatus Synoicihabitans sp.]|nr:hypothetical protein [Candidatus Synoicihabitans sp.]
WRGLLNAHEYLGELPAAGEAGQVLARLNPPDLPAVHFRVARALAASDPDAARRHVLQALEDAPRFRAAYEVLASLPPAPLSATP